MRWRLTVLAAAALLGAVTLASAANFPTDSLNFPTDEVRFGGDSIAFPSELIAEEKGATIEVTLPADILFDFDKADIKPEATTALHELADILREKARGPVTVKGYTDALGKDAYNQKLSEKRAAAIKTWLTSRESLGSLKYATVGYGPRDPVAPNTKPDGTDNPEGRQLNRRVTIVMTR